MSSLFTHELVNTNATNSNDSFLEKLLCWFDSVCIWRNWPNRLLLDTYESLNTKLSDCFRDIQCNIIFFRQTRRIQFGIRDSIEIVTLYICVYVESFYQVLKYSRIWRIGGSEIHCRQDVMFPFLKYSSYERCMEAKFAVDTYRNST